MNQRNVENKDLSAYIDGQCLASDNIIYSGETPNDVCESINKINARALCAIDNSLQSECELSSENAFFERGVQEQKNFFNAEAIGEIAQLREEQEYNERLEKSKSFRKKVWETVTSPWETTKKIGRGIKSAFNFFERINPSVVAYQDTKAKFEKSRVEMFRGFEEFKLDFQSPANANYQFIKEKGRLPEDNDELNYFKSIRVTNEFNRYTENYNKAVKEEYGSDQKDILKDIVDKSSYLRFKQSPRNWYNQSWLGNKRPVGEAVGEFLRAPGTWRNFKAFFSSKNPVYPDVYASNTARSSSTVFAPVAAYYAEENTNSGVSREVPVAVMPRKVEKPKRGGYGMKLAAAVLAGAAFLGLYQIKKNQKVDNNSNQTDASMVASNENGAIKVGKDAIITESKDNLEDFNKKSAAEDSVKKDKPKIIGLNYRKSAKSAVQTFSPIDKTPKLSDKPVDEAAKDLLVQDAKLKAELKKYKDSLAARLTKLKVKVQNPGYVVVELPKGVQPWGNSITSTNIGGVPNSESYENHIAEVEKALAKENVTQADLTAADAALTKSEDRMANNIIAENGARFRNAFNLHIVSAQAKLRNYKNTAAQQLARGETDSENMLRVKVSKKQEYYFVDLNKVAQDINNLPTNFSNEVEARRTVEYAAWYAESGMLRQSK